MCFLRPILSEMKLLALESGRNGVENRQHQQDGGAPLRKCARSTRKASERLPRSNMPTMIIKTEKFPSPLKLILGALASPLGFPLWSSHERNPARILGIMLTKTIVRRVLSCREDPRTGTSRRRPLSGSQSSRQRYPRRGEKQARVVRVTVSATSASRGAAPPHTRSAQQIAPIRLRCSRNRKGFASAEIA